MKHIILAEDIVTELNNMLYDIQTSVSKCYTVSDYECGKIDCIKEILLLLRRKMYFGGGFRGCRKMLTGENKDLL